MMSTDKQLKKWLIEVRRDFHMHPEILFQEARTTEKIMAILSELGVEHHGFEDMTGVVGHIRGREPGKTIALRADIDALPIQELNEIPYKSHTAGRMHACGHDAHTAIMLGVAKKIVDSGLSQELKGDIIFLFQPAEEGGGGAKKMIERGVLENPTVDWVIAGHMGPDMPVGALGIYRGQSHASADRFKLVIHGRGGHGARPDQTIDPIVAGAHFVTALQSIVARNINPNETAVITVGKFIAGDTSNVIPEHAELEGTIRALTEATRKLLWERIQCISDGIEKTFHTNCVLELIEGYPVCINDKKVADFLYDTASDFLGPEKVQVLPATTGAEDFAYFTQEKPGAMIRLGCGNESKGITHPLHSAFFDIDEEVLMIGVELFTEAVRRYLG